MLYEVITDVLDGFLEREETVLKKPEEEFIRSYVLGIGKKKDEIKKVIEDNMENWSFDRIGNVEKVLLQFAVYEILDGEVGHEIVVNEAVELAKIYGVITSYSIHYTKLYEWPK